MKHFPIMPAVAVLLSLLLQVLNAADAAPEIVALGDGRFRLGAVEFRKEAQSVTFPAELNLNTGPMEYLLVTQLGKLHESVLRTKVDPLQIHTAMLLVGLATPSPTNQVKPAAGAQVQNPSSERLPGKPVQIEVRWEENGKIVQRNAEEMIANIQTGKAFPKADWVYNGSYVAEKKFASQVTGSIVSLITDPAALVNNEAEGHDNDKIWTVNTNAIPALGVPVKVTFKFRPVAKP
jgi:hypothetical protein